MLHLQRYDSELSYAPGKLIVVADTLSRAAVESTNPQVDDDDETERYVHSMMSTLTINRQTPTMVSEVGSEGCYSKKTRRTTPVNTPTLFQR